MAYNELDGNHAFFRRNEWWRKVRWENDESRSKALVEVERRSKRECQGGVSNSKKR